MYCIAIWGVAMVVLSPDEIISEMEIRKTIDPSSAGNTALMILCRLCIMA
jgi:hypothetical protein